MSREDVNIRAQVLANERVCRFSLDREVFPGGLVRIDDEKVAEKSPFLRDLFAKFEVSQVLLGPDSITVEKSDSRPWSEVAREIGALIREHFSRRDGGPLIDENVYPEKKSRPDRVLKTELESFFAEKINPSLASHGGFAQVVEVRDGVAYISFGGGCQGCSAVNLTLSSQVKRQIFANFPEVRDVVDITDHQAGSNPYYR